MPTRRTARTPASAHASGAQRMRVTKHDPDCPLQFVGGQIIQHMGPCADLPLTITEGALPEAGTAEVLIPTAPQRPSAQRPSAQRPGVQRPSPTPTPERPPTREAAPAPAMQCDINGVEIADVEFLAIKQELYCHHMSTSYANLYTVDKASPKMGDAVLGFTGALHKDASGIIEGDFVDQWIVPQGAKITVDGYPVN